MGLVFGSLFCALFLFFVVLFLLYKNLNSKNYFAYHELNRKYLSNFKFTLKNSFGAKVTL